MLASLLPFVIAALGALGMALAFPKTNAVFLAPIGAIGLFWAWFGVSPKRAFWLGWLAGTIFFYINFAWFAEPAGSLIAPFGFTLALAPAVIEALLGFGITGALVALIARGLSSGSHLVRAAVPLGAAAAFAALEWIRSEGLGELGVPFASLGYTQSNAPTASVAAFAGTYGLTFLICIAGAYVAYAIRLRNVRGAAVDAAVALGAVAACIGLCAAFAPARGATAPTLRVAAVQGNIAQTLKFRPDAFWPTVERYERLTLLAAAAHPQLIVWPETVIPVAMNRDPAFASRFAALAKRVHAELVVGTLSVEPQGDYNVLYVFRPSGTLATVYRKRQLIPFAEHLPFAPFLAWIPWTKNVSNFLEGSQNGIFPVAQLRVDPIICWESDFSGIVRGDVRAGATALVMATDDAWFGTTAGPYMHAQIAQLRALETGRWIVRAASTGVSGIIAPDGRYTHASALGTATVVTGEIGSPVATPYVAIGGGAFALGFAAIYLAVFAAVRRVRTSPRTRA
jgi:apolipoprotein N-acyltransferase